MSDDRLFASNNAIGRKWFFANVIILLVITIITKFIFENFIFPDVRTDDYKVISKYLLYFLYAVYAVTFFSLVDRRLFDVLGDRERNSYKFITAFIFLAVLFNIYYFCCVHKIISVAVLDSNLAYVVSIIMDFIFIVIIFFLGILKGQISNISFDEYRKRIKYK